MNFVYKCAKTQLLALLLAPLLFQVFSPATFAATGFDSAQNAAREGRYEDVVDILTAEIDAGSLDQEDLVIAHANRGIAYSLIQAFGRARQDLNSAIKIDPEHALTQNHLGVLAEHVDNNLKAAAEWYEKAAESGFAPAQTNLGDLYSKHKVKGVSKSDSYKKAFELYSKAQAEGYVLADIALGVMYRDGKGVKSDLLKSVELFGKGAEAGAADGHYQLGIARAKGLGVEQNHLQAAAYYREAAQRGHGEAQNALGYLYRRGVGVSKDFGEAVKWYQLAADQGVLEAMNRLAWIFATCPDERFCNGEKSLEMAKAATANNTSASFMDTLAAAYARTGDYENARATMEALLSKVNVGSSRYKRYSGHLKKYQENQPYQL